MNETFCFVFSLSPVCVSYASCSAPSMNIGKVYGSEKFSSLVFTGQRWPDIPSGWKSTQRIDLFIQEKQTRSLPKRLLLPMFFKST